MGEYLLSDNNHKHTIVDKIAVNYNESAFFKAVTSLIPYAGGVANAVFCTRAAEIALKRRTEQLEKIEEQLQFLKESQIDIEFLKTEEFADLVFCIFEASSRTREKVRLDWYAKILKNSILLQDRSENSPEDYLSMLIALTVKEVNVLGVIFKQQSVQSPKDEKSQIRWVEEQGWEQLQEECGVSDEEELAFILMRLELYGLIRNITKEQIYREKWDRYIVSGISRKIIRYLDIECE